MLNNTWLANGKDLFLTYTLRPTLGAHTHAHAHAGGHGCDIIGDIIGNVTIFEYMGAI